MFSMQSNRMFVYLWIVLMFVVVGCVFFHVDQILNNEIHHVLVAMFGV